ncbi:HlyD family secretion protein [Lewinella cohaerens]|uniref:HlyD family secretion protein n=1 Tax=Lewinella cohaerens TaxID=70995 RepID=UPI000371D083|nr:HlyD family efflux transporter periplasmic adaptor subunit [Lewinella cohaerens]
MPARPSLPPLEPAEDTLAIFGRPSGWMLYWGSGVIVVFFALLLLFISWVNYPDKITTEVVITAGAPPVPVVTRTEGVVAQVFVTEGEFVETNAPLIVLDNPADLQDVLKMEELIANLRPFSSPLDIPSVSLPSSLKLGTMGRTYTQLQNLSTEIDYWLQRQSSSPRAQEITKQLEEIKKLQASLQEQLETQELETAIARNQLNQYEELFIKEAASQLEVDQAATNYLRSERQIKQQENRLTESRNREAELRESRLALGENVSDQIMERWLKWQASLRLLQQELYEWQELYVLRATQSGSISFYENIYPGLFVPPHQVVMGIVPADTTGVYLAEGLLPQTASGKILPGAKAYLELDAYPSREFGQIRAEVQQIALAANAEGGSYRLVLGLPDSLRTSYGITLQARQQMRAQAVLLSENKSLLRRLLDHLWEVGRNE